MVIFNKIWISNSCGAIYLFENVPTDKYDNNDISEWFESNEIGDEIGNNLSSCNWGELTKPVYEVRTPEDGWNEYIDSEDEEEDEEEKPIPCPNCKSETHDGTLQRPPNDRWYCSDCGLTYDEDEDAINCKRCKKEFDVEDCEYDHCDECFNYKFEKWLGDNGYEDGRCVNNEDRTDNHKIENDFYLVLDEEDRA